MSKFVERISVILLNTSFLSTSCMPGPNRRSHISPLSNIVLIVKCYLSRLLGRARWDWIAERALRQLVPNASPLRWIDLVS